MPHTHHQLEQVTDILNWKGHGSRTIEMPNFRGNRSVIARFNADDATRLRALVRAWLAADRRNWGSVLNPKSGILPVNLATAVRDQIGSMKCHLAIDDKTGLLTPWIDDTEALTFDVAIGCFLRIVADATSWRLSGPCKECSRYFICDERRSRAYCSRRCSRRESGDRMAVTRRQKRELVTRLVQTGLSKYERCADRRARAAKHANKHLQKCDKITVKTVTRWINLGIVREKCYPQFKG